MSPELSVINLATHFHRHQFQELKPLIDFYTTAIKFGAQINVDELLRTARALGMLPMVDLAARLSERSLIPNPLVHRLAVGAPSIRTRLACARLTERKLLRIERSNPIKNRLRRLIYSGTLTATARAFRTMLLPRARELEARFNRPFSPGMYPRYYMT